MKQKIIAVCLLAAVTLSSTAPGETAKAAAKPKLKTTKITVSVKKSKTIKVEKTGKFKISFQSKNKKIATVSSKGKVTGQKKGSTKIIVYYKKGKASKMKLGSVSITVTSKTTPTPAPTGSVPTPTPGFDTEPPASSVPTPDNQTPAAETPAPTPAKPTLPPGNMATVNYPTLYSDIPDLDIIRTGENYYMVSTTMNMCPGVPIMKSTDLAHWQIVNYVYDTFEDDDITNLNNGKNMYKHGSWAASLKYNEKDGKYYVAFNSNDHGFYIYTTTDIEKGTWTKYSTKTKYHDPALFFDDDKMYVISGSTLQQLELDDSKNAVTAVGRSVKLFNTDSSKWSLWEGAHAYKVGDYYYLFIIASPTGKWMRTEVCYRSKTLAAGEWEEQIVYQGGCGSNNAGLAQGGIVETQHGDWYGFLFQDSGGVGRIPSIVSVNWNYTDSKGNNYKDWPMMGSYDANGNFTPSKAKDSVQINMYDSGQENYIVADDDFTYSEGEKLKLVWQWNHNPQNDFWSVTANPGYLRLTTDRVVDNIMFAHNSLTQRTYGPSCKSETKILISQMKPGDFAGLASVSDKPAMIGVMCEKNGVKYVTQASSPFPTGDGTETTINDQSAEKLSDDAEVYLRIEYNFSGNTAKFFYSLDGAKWTELGQSQKLGFDINTTFMGTRTWLFNYATKEAGGYVDFDYYKIYK